MLNGGLSSAQIAQLANNYKLTPATLMAEVDSGWIPAPWLQYLAAEVASCIARGSCGLLVSAPPRHGKSRLITVATPLWTLENFPEKNVIVATYGEELSTDFTRDVKDLIKSNQHRLNVRIRRDVDRVQNFVTPQGGGLKAVGLRGTITGRGADVLIIDDYIKEPKEALNHTYLESLKTWYSTVARTRLEPNAVVIIVATRWVTNDLHGHIERLEARRPKKFYRTVRLQAIAGKLGKDGKWHDDPAHPDILGRKAGESLFPQRYTAQALEDIRYEVGNRWFEAMFQQNPTSEDSAATNPENIQYISREEFDAIIAQGATTEAQPRRTQRFKRVRSWDFASTKNAGDFTAGPEATYDIDTKRFYIEGMVHGQYSAGRVEQIFQQKAELDEPEREYVIEQEPGSSGKYAAEHFKTLAPTRKVRLIKSAAEGSKFLKAQPFLAATERKEVFVVVDDVSDISINPWVSKFIDEFTVFGDGAPHDDIMDALSSAYNDVTGRKPLAGAFGRSAAARVAQENLQDADGVHIPHGRGSATWGRRSAAMANSRSGYNRSGQMADKKKAQIFRSGGIDSIKRI